jgi:hypothetical protein
VLLELSDFFSVTLGKGGCYMFYTSLHVIPKHKLVTILEHRALKNKPNAYINKFQSSRETKNYTK